MLALVGVYGTTAYATRSRLREAGIRMVLGARKDQIVGALVVRAGTSVALGAVTGLIVAALGSSIVADTLRHVGPRDTGTYALVGVVVLITGLTAAWIPAAAAGRADPAVTLREE